MNYVIINGDLVPYDELRHAGVKGMKWGVRRSRTAQLYSDGVTRRRAKTTPTTTESTKNTARKKSSSGRGKRAVKIGAAIAGTALAAYGASKLVRHLNAKKHQRAALEALNNLSVHNQKGLNLSLNREMSSGLAISRAKGDSLGTAFKNVIRRSSSGLEKDYYEVMKRRNYLGRMYG